MATTKTELLNNGVVVATKTAAPFYSWDWTPASGASSLTYKRYEDNVLVFTSAATTGTVDAAAGYDVDYQAKLDFATANSIPLPSTAQSDIYNQKIIDFKTTDGWSQSPVVMDFSGVADIQFKLICIKRRVLGISYGTPTWSSDGWLGDGTTAYIDPLYDTTSDAKWLLNNAGVSWVNFQTASAGAVTGAYTGTADDYDYVLIAPKTGHIGINGKNTVTDNYTQLGFSSVNRISATQVMRNNVAVTANSNTKFAGKLLIGCRDNIDASSLDVFYDGGISFIFMGGASTDYTAMETILEA